MKKAPFVALIAMLTFVNCKKDTVISDKPSTKMVQVPNSLLTKIKLWHENKIINQGTYLYKTTNQESVKKALLIPDYSKSTYETLPNGATVTTVQADDFKFDDSSIGFFRVFVFLGGKDKIVDGKIVEFYGDVDYLKKNRKYLIDNYNKKSLKSFTGSVFTYDVYYRPLRNRTYEDGEINSAPSGIVKKASKRRANENTMMTSGIGVCEAQGSRMAEECWDVYWVTAESSHYLYRYCCSSAGGENPGGGGGNDAPVPISSFTGFPANPIEGQTSVFIDPYGYAVEFTYSSSMKVWLMPEIQALRETGNTFTITNMPVFDSGNILTSIALPALIEPTFVGEIVLGGAAAYVSVIYVYQFAKWVMDKTDHQREIMCQQWNAGCVGSGYDCFSCYRRCINDGSWPYGLCPVSPIDY